MAVQSSNNTAEMMVCQALLAATDSSAETVKKAEAQLLEWEAQPGFFATLAKLSVAHDVTWLTQRDAEKMRWMAAVYLKNGINKHWRRNTRTELPAAEKQLVRELLLTNFAAEPLAPVALQVAVLIARIARMDCPREWPELVPELLKRLQAASAAQNSAAAAAEQQHILLVFHHVVKALASRRMMGEKRIFYELSSNIFGYFYELWNGFTALFFHQLKVQPATAEAVSILERAVLNTRILRKLTIYGCNKPMPGCQTLRYVQQLFECLQQCLECRYELQRLNADEKLLTLLEKFILKQMKTLTEFQNMHASAFYQLVPMALEFTFTHVFHERARLIFTQNVMNFRQFAIHCINMMRLIIMGGSYNNHPVCDGSEDVVDNALTDFFSSERLHYINEKIITHYLLLTQAELEAWSDDPEGFAQDDVGGESFKYELRASVESLFVAFFTQYNAEMCKHVVKYVRSAQSTQLSAESQLSDILLKDAIYNAANLASFHLVYDVDFDAWFSGQLLQELRIEADNFRILRRRIICLVAGWSRVSLSLNVRPLAFEACLHMLRPGEDLTVRLCAARTVSALINEFEFSPETFLPYLAPIFNSLFQLLRESKECDTKMSVLTVMSLVVEKMSDHIEPQADTLISYLPLLWKESEEYNMLRCAIISTLQQLVKAVRDMPEKVKPFLCNVIELSTNLQEPSHIYLMEEGLALWGAVVENSSVMTAPLMELCKNLLPIIEESSENLRTVLVLIQAYIMLDAHAYLGRYGRQFVQYCMRMFNDLRPEGIVMMLKVFETCLKVDANNGMELVRPALAFIFKQVYMNKEYPILMSMYLVIVARVLLISQSVFTEVLQELQLPNAFETILDVWLGKMPLITDLEKRKLFCLALASIFMNDAILLERFPAIMQYISITLHEVMREDIDELTTDDAESDAPLLERAIAADAVDDDDGLSNAAAAVRPVKYCDSLVFVDEHDFDTSNFCTMDDFDYKTHHYDRCRLLSLKDPVHLIVLPEYIDWHLTALRANMGEDGYQQLMRSVYADVLVKAGKFVKLNLSFEPN